MTINFYLIVALILAILVIIIGAIIWRKLRQNDLLKYEFITILIHKFRTPLTRIKWSIDELRIGETDQDKLDNFKNMENSNRDLINLTSTLVDISDPRHSFNSFGNFEKLSLSNLLQNVADSFKDTFSKKQIKFSLNCPSEDVMVNTDKEMTKFLIQILLENALAYTPNNGQVSLLLEVSSNKAVVSVVDNGIGIKKDNLNLIFTRSYRAENAKITDREGFGVGLHLARSVARRYKGDMKVYSDGEGKGSIFKLILPMV